MECDVNCEGIMISLHAGPVHSNTPTHNIRQYLPAPAYTEHNRQDTNLHIQYVWTNKQFRQIRYC